MKIVTDAGAVIAIGTTETAPTIGITDYSRRVTDDFGVTTVVRRGFARRMSLRFAVPFAAAGTVQAQLADLRATPALWVADDRYRALSVRGLYKDFDVDLAVPPMSYCSLTVEGLAENDLQPDPGGDPAPEGQVSALRMVQPVTIGDDMLIVSNVAEDDAPLWSATVTYPEAARVMVGHVIYESLVAANIGNDPAGGSGKWVEVGPTNRWAAFDQALGTATSAVGPIVVTLATGAADTVALLDVTGATVRVQAGGYDRTLAIGPAALVFDGLTGGAVTVTIAGGGTVAVGTLLVGRTVALGVTEASPSAGITDYSRKDVDDFGEVTIVQRAWSKRMQARALIRSDAVDAVFDRIAAVRAVPALWIGDADNDALTIYGFFKDFSIEVGEGVSKLSLAIEGLSKAAKVEPLKTSIDWPDVGDPDGTKPQNNATWGAPDGTMVGGVEAGSLIADFGQAKLNIAEGAMVAGTWRADTDKLIYQPDGTASRTVIEQLGAESERHRVFITDLSSVDPVTGIGKRLMAVNSDLTIVGMEAVAGGGLADLRFLGRRFVFVDEGGGNPTRVLDYQNGEWVFDSNISARKITYESLIPKFAGPYQNLDPNGWYQELPGGLVMMGGRMRANINNEVQFSIVFPRPFPNQVLAVNATPYITVADDRKNMWLQNVGEPSVSGASFFTQAPAGDVQQINGFDWMAFGR